MLQVIAGSDDFEFYVPTDDCISALNVALDFFSSSNKSLYLVFEFSELLFFQ